MISLDTSVGSFTYMTFGETDVLVKRLVVVPFDPNTADAGVHSTVNERYAKKVLSKFNFPVGTEIVIPRQRDMASLCPLGFLAAYFDQSRLT